jgi:hypothetical protein
MPKLVFQIGGGVIAAVVLLYFYMSRQCEAQAEQYGRTAEFGFTTGCLMQTPFGVWVPMRRHAGGGAGGGHH